MARPNKQGVDYFPLDIHLDDKFKFIEIKYKLEGFAILIKLLQKIYSYGYWYRWTDDEALLFSDEIRTEYETVSNVVNECLNRGVFDKEMYETYSILTSKGIQKRYKEIVRRRKDVEVMEEYLLIDNTFGVNDDINPSSSVQNVGKSTQSKVKEKKVKETIDTYSNEFEQFWNLYPKKLDKKKALKSFTRALKGNSLETILEGTKRYADFVSGKDPQYTKHASTFLNNDSFIDEYGKPNEPQHIEQQAPQFLF